MSTEYQNEEITAKGDVEKMLGGLKRVSAPSDFDMRLKARIIERNSASETASGWKPWRIAVPAAAAAVLLIAGYFAVSNFVQNDPGQIAVTEPNAIELPRVEDDHLAPTVAKDRPAPAPENVRSVQELATRDAVPVSNTGRRNGPNGGGSEDRAATAADEPILPPGIVPESRGNERPPGTGATSEISVNEILELAGLRAKFENGRWTVISADPNGAAGRSGIRPGDEVVAIDRTNVVSRSSISGPANVRNITVRRSGAVIEIPVKR